MSLISWIVTHVAPLFLVSSPITSYADQIYSIHKTHSSAGFSLDIPLIMLVASILKIFYWFGEHYDNALLLQAILMVCVQTVLLHVALENRPSLTTANAKPFDGMDRAEPLFSRRPYHFWQWRSSQPYWSFLAYYTLVLLVLGIFIGDSKKYIELQGYVALSIEAMLPLPQIASNQRNRSCKGFRLSVLLNWLIGDALKMSFFFLAESDIPWAFKLCGIFQALCDCYLGVQYWMFGEGQDVQYSPEDREMRKL
ncbi:PQ loop repeat-containing protein 1 [Elsinoe fawcettii]|nr:PQ loop repeat-containing protein 1 [Elsinoe fawcettii]